jgi:hypothetical protein
MSSCAARTPAALSGSAEAAMRRDLVVDTVAWLIVLYRHGHARAR